MGGHNLGRQAKSREKRDTARAAKEFKESLKWKPPAELETEPGIWTPLTETARVRVVTHWSKTKPRRIVDYAVIQHTLHEMHWCNVVRVDCDHSEVHRHGPDFLANGKLRRSLIREITQQSDVEDTYNEQRDSILTNFEDAERKWHESRRINNVPSSQLFEEIDEDDFDEPPP